MTYDDNSHVSSLTRFSLDRRITVLVLFLSILVVGVIASLGIPLELFPRGYTAQSLQVFVPWTDSPGQEVLEKITLPLEEELSTVKGLDGLYSYSSTGRSNVWMRFKHGTDMDVAYREVRDRVERAKVVFPDGADRAFVHKEDISGIPVAAIGMAIDPSLTDYYDLVQKHVVLPFSRIDGVASVTTDGLEEKEIIIEVDRDLAEGAGLNIYQLAQELGDDNFTMASGNVRDSGKKFLLRSVATYDSFYELENRLITPSIRLKDIAGIRYEEAEKRYSVRVNSRPAVAIIILKEGEANTVEVSRKINAALEEMRNDPRLASVYMENLFNQGDVIEDSVSSLLNGGRIGGILAAVVLFLFLRRFRMTAIITLSIPLSLLIALVTMFFLGETLNILSILGLMICVGLLVDNSVVVAENIHRLHREGLPRRQACVQGASEIALAIIMATLTTVIVFLPASLVDGQAQFFLLRLSLPISVSLIASLFIALIFIPLCVYLTLPSARKTKKKNAFHHIHEALNTALRHAYEQTFERLNNFYTRCLEFFLNHRLDMVLALFAVLGLTMVVFQENVEFVNEQEEDSTNFTIHVRLSSENNFQDTSAYFKEAEALLEKKQEEYGLKGYLAVHFSRSGRIQGWFDRETPQELSAKEVAEKLLEELPQRAGVELFYGNESRTDEDEGEETYVVRLEGEEAEQLETIAEKLTPILLQVEGVLGIKKGEDESPNELALVVDRDRATASGVNPEFIAGVVGYALRGSALPYYNDGGREIPVRIRFQEEDRENLDELASFAVPTASGETLPVSALTEARMLNTPRGIYRANKKVRRNITLELMEENVDETRQRLGALTAAIDLPEGVSFGISNRGNDDEELQTLGLAMLLSIAFIYLLMGFLFESFVLPLSIILTIPAASIGVAFGHLVAGKDMDFLGVVGSVLLVGVVVNNGIVLIDYVNRLRATGIERTKALLLASHRRFRPIVMTALTTIIGMIPLTVSKPSSLGLSYKSFGITLIGGMSTATLLTLLVVPVFYTLFDDLRLVSERVLRQLTKKKKFSGQVEAGAVALHSGGNEL